MHPLYLTNHVWHKEKQWHNGLDLTVLCTHRDKVNFVKNLVAVSSAGVNSDIVLLKAKIKRRLSGTSAARQADTRGCSTEGLGRRCRERDDV